MAPLLLFPLVLPILSLLLIFGSVLADSSQGVPLKLGPRSGNPSPCPPNFQAQGKLSSNCQTNTRPNQQYCSQYRAICNQFSNIFQQDTLPGYSTYCRNLDTSPCSTRALKPKDGSPSKRATPNRAESHRRDYKSGSGFDVRADNTGNLTADNLGVFTSGDLWYGMEITLGGQSESTLDIHP